MSSYYDDEDNDDCGDNRTSCERYSNIKYKTLCLTYYIFYDLQFLVFRPISKWRLLLLSLVWNCFDRCLTCVGTVLRYRSEFVRVLYVLVLKFCCFKNEKN